MDEIQKCREELGGPFFNKRDNQRLRKHHEQVRKQEESRNALMRPRFDTQS